MLSASPSTEKTYSDESFDASDPFNVPWHELANCYRNGYTLFFHEGRLKVQEFARRAKEYCEGCPVLEICLRSSLEHRDQFGIWGGLTPKERQRLLKRIDAGELTKEEAIEQVCYEHRAA